jgi:hypothetical protein
MFQKAEMIYNETVQIEPVAYIVKQGCQNPIAQVFDIPRLAF